LILIAAFTLSTIFEESPFSINEPKKASTVGMIQDQ
jgi:hypothetical protein